MNNNQYDKAHTYSCIFIHAVLRILQGAYEPREAHCNKLPILFFYACIFIYYNNNRVLIKY